jgi:hypothetical protein
VREHYEIPDKGGFGRMKRLKWVVLAVCVCLIVFAVVVPALAGSGGNPQWSVEGTQLALSESKSVTGEASGIQKLKSAETTIACTSLSLGAGSVITGGSGSTPGTATETLVYSGCVVENTTSEEVYAGCKVNSVGETAGTLKTQQLVGKLAYTGQVIAEHEEPTTLTVLKPETGTTFLTVEYSGEHCPAPGNGKYTIEGEIALKNPEGSTEKTKHTAEGPLTSVKVYWLNSGGVPEEHKVKGIKIGGTTNAVYLGNSVLTTSPEARFSAVH